MAQADVGALSRDALAHADDHQLAASGVFQFADATYSVQFQAEGGLLRCLDTMMSFEPKPATPRLYLKALGRKPPGPEWPPSNLRFDFDRAVGVGAAVLLAIDRHGEIHAWMTRGDVDHRDVLLTHDAWNPDERRFPSSALVELADLRRAIAQWAFGDVLPPPAVEWNRVPDDEVGWF